MSQKNAFIVDDDREFALTVAAALSGDGFKVSIAKGDRDPLDEIRSERPDIVLVRAERSSKDSGFTLCSRVKRSKRLVGTPVFLYASDGSSETIESHRTQETRADDYLILPSEPPYPLDELRERVRNLLSPPGGLERPPRLPAAAKEEVKDTTPRDNSFIERVMDSLNKQEPEDVPSRIPQRRDGSSVGRRTTADAKLDMLRQKLRQRETELGQMMEMYRAKEREYHQFNERLVEKDVEAQSLKMTIDELSSQMEEAKAELDRRIHEFNTSFEHMLEEKVTRENELIQVVAAKEKALADLGGALHEAVTTSSTKISALEGSLAETDDAKSGAEKKAAALEGALLERENSIARLDRDLATERTEGERLRGERDSLAATIERHEDQIASLETVILEVRNDLAEVREQSDSEGRTLAAEVGARDEALASLRQEIAAAEVDRQREAGRQAESDAQRHRLLEELEGVRAQASLNSRELTDRIESLEAQLAEEAELYRELEALSEEERRKLSGEAERLDLAHQEARREAEDVSTMLRATERDLIGARETLALQEGRLAEVQDALRHEKEERARREQVLDGTRDLLLQRQSELSTARAEASERALRLEETRRALDQREVDLLDARKRGVELENDVARRAETEERGTAERDQLRAKTTELGADLEVMREERDRLQHEIALLEQEASSRAKLDNAAYTGLARELEAVRATQKNREDEIRVELESRDAHLAALDREISSTRGALDAERGEGERVARELEGLEAELDQAREDLLSTSHQAALDKQSLESALSAAGSQIEAARMYLEETKQQLAGESDLVRARVNVLERELGGERQLRERESERLRGEAAVISERLEVATARAAALAQEKRAIEEQKQLEIKQRDEELRDVKRRLDARQAEISQRGTDFEDRAAKLQARAHELSEALEVARRERDDVENRYIREIEDANEGFIEKEQELEAKHAREVEQLRAEKLEATRQLRTSQLAAQRLTDRVQKLEAQRTQKSGAEEDFDSFMRQFQDSKVPGAASSPPTSAKISPESAKAPVPGAPAASAPPAASAQQAGVTPSGTQGGKGSSTAAKASGLPKKTPQTFDPPTQRVSIPPLDPARVTTAASPPPSGPGANVVSSSSGIGVGAARALETQVAVRSEPGAEDEDDITIVSKLGSRAEGVPPETTKRSSSPANEDDAFLTAFDREFEDIKKG